MNVAAYQKNDNSGKRKEERKQPTDFREAACCPSPVVQRAARR